MGDLFALRFRGSKDEEAWGGVWTTSVNNEVMRETVLANESNTMESSKQTRRLRKERFNLSLFLDQILADSQHTIEKALTPSWVYVWSLKKPFPRAPAKPLGTWSWNKRFDIFLVTRPNRWV